MRFAVNFTVSALGADYMRLARLAGSEDQAAIRRWVREEAELVVRDHFARKGVGLRFIAGALAPPPGQRLTPTKEGS